MCTLISLESWKSQKARQELEEIRGTLRVLMVDNDCLVSTEERYKDAVHDRMPALIAVRQCLCQQSDSRRIRGIFGANIFPQPWFSTLATGLLFFAKRY